MTRSVVGYFLYGQDVKGNVLIHFTTRNDALMIVVSPPFHTRFSQLISTRLCPVHRCPHTQVISCYLLKTVFAYPLANFPLRVTLHYQLYRDAVATTTQHVLETLAPFAVSLGVALVVEDVSVLFSFVGAIARTSISFLFPAALLLRSSKAAPSRGDAVLCYFLIVFGTTVMLAGVGGTIYELVQR